MWEDTLRVAGRLVFFLTLCAMLGCGPSGSESREDWLIRVDAHSVTTRDFLEAFELAKTAYPQGADVRGSGLNDARQKLLDEMTIELVMLKRSNEMGISISEAEVDAAVAALISDYPPGVFEQTLIEAAVPFEAWKQRVRTRLLLERIVDLELRDQITITPEDVLAYYDLHYQGKAAGADSDGKFQRLKETIVADLRRKKLEEAYGVWVSELKQKYAIEVNRKLWDQITETVPVGQDPGTVDSSPGK